MIELNDDMLTFRFPDVHDDAVCPIGFQRTLRIPDDNRQYPLPPGLGRFSIEHVEDHFARLPRGWGDHGGVLLPMCQAEALWINFSRRWRATYPCAVKVAAGKINAVTGEAWSKGLSCEPQDYVVVPEQPWLDGFCVRKGLIRQFVAMPLGQGYTAEEQISGAADHGGLQIIVYPMKRERYQELIARRNALRQVDRCYTSMDRPVCASPAMGLAPGGLMHQELYEDEYGIDAWETSVSSRCFVHILNSLQWQVATGKAPPGKAPTAADYTDAGLPWFDYYDDTLAVLGGSNKLAGLDSVAAKAVKKGEQALAKNDAVQPTSVVKLGRQSERVSEGQW